MATLINLNGTTPAAPSNGVNIIWQSDASSPVNVSAYINFAAIVADVSITGMLAVTGAISSGASITSSTDIISLQTSPATGGTNFSSGHFELIGNYWTGSVSAADTWTIQNVLGAGANPVATLEITHAGSSGGGVIVTNVAFTCGEIHSGEIFTGGSVELTASPATNIANISSYLFQLDASYWTGSVSAGDTWTIQNVMGTGANPTSTLTLLHSGSGGTAALNLNYPVTIGAIQTVEVTSSGSINVQAGNSFTQISSNGALLNIGQSSELLTLSLASTHTDTSSNLLPAGAIIDSVVIYITQTISGGSTPTTIAVGDASTSNRFISTGTPLTTGSSAVGLNQIDAGASSQTAAAKVRVTLDQIPGQGIVRITVFYRVFTAPTS